MPATTGGREIVPSPAATVVPLRDGDSGVEVLMLERTRVGASQFAGMWVFPGGQVDDADATGATVEAGVPSANAEIAAARRAAVREAREEAGLGLGEGSLVTLSFWCPPPESPRRFATWFFLAPVENGAAVTVDGEEIRSARWLTPEEAIAARDSGQMNLAPPTFTTLWWLSAHETVESALAAAAGAEPERFLTRPVQVDGKLAALLWEGDAGYEERDPDRPGRRRRLWLEESRWRLEIDR